MVDLAPNKLGATLKSKRRAKRLTLRDLSEEIGVSLNTLSRVERGHVPDLKNFHLIVDWLEIPAETFLHTAADDELRMPEVIARHLRSDVRLTAAAAEQISALVEEMYEQLVKPRVLSMHLRSAKTFTPAAGALLAEILDDMQTGLLAE